MPRSLDHRAPFPHPAEAVHPVLTGRATIERRLQELGGPGAALLSYEETGDGVRYTLRHGISAADLPSVVSSLVPGDLRIERTEEWHPAGPGVWEGTGTVQVHGAPASATSTMRLTDADGGSEVTVHADVTVKVPILGGTIEESVAGQIRRLLDAEAEFTAKQIGR
ncbi:DUF2505 domain-containing protein [Pseudonocardia phyllosphaerae]|uniref:DUF2505 domain-containing protein n=1 Tax=Pseudonocardia phyllosphaerae TaxID=3390502 RepID=UPI0039783BC1